MSLKKLNGTTKLEQDLIEGWTSLIWTERYSDAGDFTLVTPDITNTRALLPEGTLVAIDESDEVMWVENSEVKEVEGKGKVLTITGRSFETFFEKRAILTGVTPVTFNRTAATAVLLLMNLHGGNSVQVSYDAITNFSATSTVAAALATESYKFDQQGDVYAKMLEILKGDNLGIKNIRPYSSGGTLVTNVYDGLDRTSDQTTNAKVTLDYTRGDLSEGSYLWTDKNYRNIAYVNAPIGFRVVGAPGVSTTISGLSRRVLYVDASDLTDPGADTVIVALNKRGRVELAKYNQRAFVDGKMSPEAQFVFGTHYKLGDKLTAKGEYNMLQDMFVTEYIRSWGENGSYTSYPTLTQI